MTNLLVQNYLNNQKTSVASQPQEQQVIHPVQIPAEQLKTNLRPYSPSGYLLKENPVSYVKGAVKKNINDIKFFFKAINGEGTDFSIGSINDVAIKLGSLGIAGIIAASSGSPVQKGMEFVGLGCWFGAMSLWPALAIKTPIQLKTGINLNQQYIDSYGRQKYFYQDPQYVCWDMMSDKELNKIGDKLGIPKNIKNRKEATKNKVKEITTQGNTLAMITAGFATPIIASLMADQIGKRVITPLVEKARYKKAEKQLIAADKVATTIIEDEKAMSQIGEIFGQSKDEISAEQIDKLRKLFGTKFNNLEKVQVTLEQFLNVKSSQKTLKVDSTFIENVIKIVEKINKEHSKHLEDLPVSISDKVKSVFKEGTGINAATKNTLVAKLTAQLTTKNGIQGFDNGETPILSKEINALLDQNYSFKTDVPLLANKVKKLYKVADTYSTRVEKDLYNFYRASIIGDGCVNANSWNNAFTEIVDALGFKGKELKGLAFATPDQYYVMLEKRMQEIAQDPKNLEKTVVKLAKVASKASEKNEIALNRSLSYIEKLEKTLISFDSSDDFQELVKNIRMKLSVERTEILNKYIDSNNTFFRPIKILQVFEMFNNKSAVKKFMQDSYINKMTSNIVSTDPELAEAAKFPKTHFEEIIKNGEFEKTAKQILLKSNNADLYINTLNQYAETIRTPEQYKGLCDILFGDLSGSVKSVLESSNDEAIKGLSGKINSNGRMMRTLFSNLNDEVNIRFGAPDVEFTKKLLKNTPIETYVNDYFNINYGKYTTKTGKLASSEGKTFFNFMKEGAQKSYTYKVWLKRVGIAGIAVLGFTALSLLFLGRKNAYNPDKYEKLEGVKK